MDKTFQKFLRSGIDLSPVGVERREGNILHLPIYMAMFL